MRDTDAVPHAPSKNSFEYIKAGFHPEWDKDPYRVFVYTHSPEVRRKQSHSNTGRVAASTNHCLAASSGRLPWRSAHFTFYRNVFSEICSVTARSAAVGSAIMPPSTCRCHDTGIQGIRDVIRGRGSTVRATISARAGSARPRKIEALTGLDLVDAQEKLLGIPERYSGLPT